MVIIDSHIALSRSCIGLAIGEIHRAGAGIAIGIRINICAVLARQLKTAHGTAARPDGMLARIKKHGLLIQHRPVLQLIDHCQLRLYSRGRGRFFSKARLIPAVSENNLRRTDKTRRIHINLLHIPAHEGVALRRAGAGPHIRELAGIAVDILQIQLHAILAHVPDWHLHR